MIMKKTGIIKRGIAAGLISLMACVNPLQTMAPVGTATVAKAADKDAKYVEEVRLAVDKDESKAKQILTDAGYEVIDQNLNEKAGSFFNERGDQAVYMGIKRTDDKKKAIRDMKTMNMLGQYSYSDLKKRIENNKADAKNLYNNLKVAIKEYADNYKKDDFSAKLVHDIFNMYRDDDSNKLIGELFLGDIDEEQMLEIMATGNTYILASIFNTLSYAVEKANDNGKTWIDRLSKVSSYNAVVKQYAKERFNTSSVSGEKKAEVETIVETELDETAGKLLANWGDIRKIFTDTADEEKIVDEFDGNFDDAEEFMEVTESAKNVEAVKLAKSLPYGKKTVYDYFKVPTATLEKNIKNLYPLAYALSEGQRKILDFSEMSSLIQAALIRRSEKEKASEYAETLKDTQKQIDEAGVVSVYEDVDRSMFSENAAMTSRATANMKADPDNAAEIDSAKKWTIGWGIATAVFAVLGVLTYPLEKIFYKMFMNRGGSYSWFLEAYEYMTPIRVLFFVVSGILAVVSAIQYYRMKLKANNTKQLPIPDILVDYDVEGKAGRNVVYHAVKWNLSREAGRDDRADLNGDAGREWLALYTTTDAGMGEPILAGSIVAKTGDAGGNNAPGNDYEPLKLFGREAIQNLVDETYSFNDKVGGIWMWYQRDTASTDVEDDTKNNSESETEPVASTTGSNIGSGTMVFGITGGAVGGFIIGILVMMFYRRKREEESK